MSCKAIITSTLLLSGAALSGALAGTVSERTLLTQEFEPRKVAQIDVGDFHFAPGQLGPLHQHAAPVFGYVSKGTIFYQVEGQAPQILKAGDAFYEPAGPNIIHFDNASKTDEAVFTDFNFERADEPFIVLPKPLTEKIDRRSFQAESLDGSVASHVDVTEQLLAPLGDLAGARQGETIAAYVAEGVVSVRVGTEAPVIYQTGQTFYVARSGQKQFNPSKSQSARVVLFRLTNGA
jgi:quercetin dioxygenase-like cupin family protein